MKKIKYDGGLSKVQVPGVGIFERGKAKVIYDDAIASELLKDKDFKEVKAKKKDDDDKDKSSKEKKEKK